MLLFRFANPKKVKTPVTVLGAGADTIFSPAEIEKTAKAYGKKAKIFENMAHDMMLDDGWETVADYVIKKLRSV
jgi:alpha-beta hydrolase superfamily lysophospholipase